MCALVPKASLCLSMENYVSLFQVPRSSMHESFLYSFQSPCESWETVETFEPLVGSCPITEEMWWRDKISPQVSGFNGSGSNTNAAEITINDSLITERQGLISASAFWEIMRNISMWKLPWSLGVFGPRGAMGAFGSVQMLLENPQDKCSYFTSHFPIFIFFSFLPD